MNKAQRLIKTCEVDSNIQKKYNDLHDKMTHEYDIYGNTPMGTPEFEKQRSKVKKMKDELRKMRDQHGLKYTGDNGNSDHDTLDIVHDEIEGQ